MAGSKKVRRLYWFVRDLATELPAIWSLARTHDCERNGGHRWGEYHNEEFFHDTMHVAWGHTCSRCGVWQSSTMQPVIVPTTVSGAGSTYTLTYNTSGGPANGR